MSSLVQSYGAPLSKAYRELGRSGKNSSNSSDGSIRNDRATDFNYNYALSQQNEEKTPSPIHSGQPSEESPPVSYTVPQSISHPNPNYTETELT